MPAATAADPPSPGSAVVVVCMPERGHLQRLLPLIECLAGRGRSVPVLTDRRFAGEVERAGGRFVDLFARFSLEAADATSVPLPSRYVSFAGVYAEDLTVEVARLAPALIVYDTFAVVAPLIGRRLGVPYVNVCAGHAADPVRTVAALRQDPRVATSAACWQAVERLRARHGMPEASPFSYVEGVSPFLNLYGEPEQFLSPPERAAFEPLAFFGCLAPGARAAGADAGTRAGGASPFPGTGARIYVSFGTVVWRYFAAAACAALGVLADAFADRDVQVLMSLGGHPLEEERRTGLERRNVRVEPQVDQWAVLAAADAFVTHHGLNSTHEAIYHRVPMISYPFFDDQPALARRCQELGLAVPLVASPRAPLDRRAVGAALRRLADDRPRINSRLAEARSWEIATIAGREAVVDRVLALAGPGGGG